MADGVLAVGGVPLPALARRFGTPLYVLDAATLRGAARAYREALARYPGPARAVFACKAQCAVAVLRLLHEEGMGADVASAGELAAALAAGVPGRDLVVHGNNKSDAELEAAVEAEAGLVVLDHAGEADRLERAAAARGRVQPVLVRVTPDVEADTHHKIRTGHAASKFGLPPDEALAALARAGELPHLDPRGLHVHLGSQIRDARPLREAVRRLSDLAARAGAPPVAVLDVGGGLAAAHGEHEDAAPIGRTVAAVLDEVAGAFAARGLPLPEVVLEPGRSVTARAGVTLYTVGAVKRTAAGVVYAAVDGGMADNPRPALYDARYTALVAERADAPAVAEYAVAGKHCESGDILVQSVALPDVAPGDLLCVPATGAYGASMASNYNMLPRPAAVLVDDGEARLIQRRETIADLLAREV